MSSEYCDWEPCHWLKKFIEQKMDDGTEGTVSMDVVQRSRRKEKTRKLHLWYCPFCGTRLHDNKEVMKWVEDNRKK